MPRGTVAAALAAVAIGSGLAAAAPERRAVAATVTVSVSGGGRVHSEPAGPIDCGSRCTAELEVGSSLVLRAVPDSGRALSGWDGECSGRSTTCALVVEGPTTISATFGSPAQLATPKVLDLTRSVGGRVVGDPAGFIDCGSTCTTAWPDGGELTLRAEPATGFTFDSWDGDCTGTAPCRLSLTEDRDATAFFRPVSFTPGSADLTINVRLVGTQVGAVGVNIDNVQQSDCEADEAPCSYDADHGDLVVLTPAGGTLDAWEGACVGNSELCRFVFTGATAVTGVFRAGGPVPSFGVNVARAGSGRVVSTPRGIDCGPNATCAAAFGTKTRVRLTATATGGSTFAGWSGDCGGTGECSVVADTTRSVIATFRLARQTLSVEIRGRGRGSVRSTPVGIVCPPDCAYAFRDRENVTLTAVPAAGSRFVAWDGACTGASCTLTVAAGAVARATFERCATLDFSGFAVRTLRGPRRIRISVRLTGGATVRLVLLRGRSVVRRYAPRQLAAGTHTFVLRPGRSGRHGVRMTMADRCGGSKARTRVVRVR